MKLTYLSVGVEPRTTSSWGENGWLCEQSTPRALHKFCAPSRQLQEHLHGVQVVSVEKLGMDSDAKEVRISTPFLPTGRPYVLQAICFALLGYETYRGRPSNVPSKNPGLCVCVWYCVCTCVCV